MVGGCIWGCGRVDEQVNIMICIFSNYQYNLLHIKLAESGNGDGASC